MKYVIEAFSILFTLMVGLYGSVSGCICQWSDSGGKGI